MHSAKRRPLRVLLISDNRDNPNWGSRSSTMALLELLGEAGLSPDDRIMDSEVRSTVPASSISVLDKALRNERIAALASAGLMRGGRSRRVLERVLGLHEAVTEDPAATVAHWRRSARAPMDRWLRMVDAADLVVVNGEGSMIFTTPARIEQRFHLAMMQAARERGVPFTYVNALASDPSRGAVNERMRRATIEVLEHAACVTTRDPASQRYLQELSPTIPVEFVPDAVFAWRSALEPDCRDAALRDPRYLVPFHPAPDRLGAWNFERPYLCVGGSSEAAKDQARARAAYAPLLAALEDLGLPVIVTVSCHGDRFLEDLAHQRGLPVVPVQTNISVAAAILANAELVVTGRYHPAILAALGGTPCVLLGADSHKTTSVQTMLGYPEVRVAAAFPDEGGVREVIRTATDILTDRARWSRAIQDAVEVRAEQARALGAHVRAGLERAAP